MLAQGSETFVSAEQLASFNGIRLDPAKEQAYLKEIVENGTPSKQEIVAEVRNFFEGPINMDLMVAAQIMNFLNDKE